MNGTPARRDISPQRSPNGGRLRHDLAAATRDLHAALHRHLLMGRLTAPDLTEPQYRAALTVLLHAHCATEARRSAAGLWPDLALGRECAALARDLDMRGGRQAPAPGGTSGMLGALYVLHGAAFGGAVIARALDRSLPHLPHRYYRLPRRPSRWRRLVAALDAASNDPAARAAAIADARATFAALLGQADNPAEAEIDAPRHRPDDRERRRGRA